ncbi:phosphatidylserine synthase [Acinetobacter baumannii]|nr:phosphatidylserine synthase [Acinetobacter baumannii]
MARDYPFIFDLRDIAIQVINAVIMVVVGLLMISNIKYYSFKQMDRKRVPFVVMLPVVLIFAAITYNIPMGILIVSIIYALSGFVTTLLAKKNNETIKT